MLLKLNMWRTRSHHCELPPRLTKGGINMQFLVWPLDGGSTTKLWCPTFWNNRLLLSYSLLQRQMEQGALGQSEAQQWTRAVFKTVKHAHLLHTSCGVMCETHSPTCVKWQILKVTKQHSRCVCHIFIQNVRFWIRTLYYLTSGEWEWVVMIYES